MFKPMGKISQMLLLALCLLAAGNLAWAQEGGPEVDEKEGVLQADADSPQILTSDLSKKQTVIDPQVSATFIFVDTDNVTRVVIDGEEQKFTPSGTVMITKTFTLEPDVPTTIRVAAQDEKGHVRQRAFRVKYLPDHWLFGRMPAYDRWVYSEYIYGGTALLMGAITMMEIDTIKKSNTKQQDLVNQANNATNLQTRIQLNSQVNAEQQKALSAAGVAVVTMGIGTVAALWFSYDWFDKPEIDDEMELVPYMNPVNGETGVLYAYRF
ncbi:MAG: hypothetical protein OEV94_08840 [Deltaproteobacteria bacterium]|nr:hypothetical protein [Deltaproteobacteria bacterium]